MPLALLNSVTTSMYSFERDLTRLAELYTSEIVGADHARYRSAMPLGSALGDDHRLFQMAHSWAAGADVSSVLALIGNAHLQPGARKAVVHQFPVSKKIHDTWLENVNSIGAQSEMEDLSVTIKSLMAQFRDNQESVTSDLKKIDLLNANAMHLVAILRSLFAWRDHISTWRELRDGAEKEFDRRRLKTHLLLRGLINK